MGDAEGTGPQAEKTHGVMIKDEADEEAVTSKEVVGATAKERPTDREAEMHDAMNEERGKAEVEEKDGTIDDANGTEQIHGEGDAMEVQEGLGDVSCAVKEAGETTHHAEVKAQGVMDECIEANGPLQEQRGDGCQDVQEALEPLA